MKTLNCLLALAPAADPREEWLAEWKQAEWDEWRQETDKEDRLLARWDLRGDA